MRTDTKERTHPAKEQEDHQGMISLAREVEQHHLQSMPEAIGPVPAPFPALVNWGLGLGILIGAVLGLIFGALLYNGLLVFERWDNLYSMAPLAFHVFWMMIGTALGVIVGGIGTILAAKPEQDQAGSRLAYYEVDTEDSRVS